MVVTRLENVDMAAASPWVDTSTATATVPVTSIGGGTPMIVVAGVVPGRMVPHAIPTGPGGAVVNVPTRDPLIPLTSSSRLFSFS